MDLLEAGKVLAGRLLGKFRIVFIGPTRDEGYLDTMKSYVSENGLEDCVTILPGRAQEDLPDAYEAADVIAFPSLSEGLGLTALEAFAMKKPVVAYRTGGLPEVVRDGTTGALVDRGDVRALAGALAELLVHPERCRELGENGRKLVDSEFNPKVLAERYMDLYRGLCSSLRANAR
jgi:glycosyltransferase involved in cell wall biosynthesis